MAKKHKNMLLTVKQKAELNENIENRESARELVKDTD
jgi:hypothetical protein